MNTCQSCGVGLTDDAVFCSSCGAAVGISPTQFIEASPDIALEGMVIDGRYRIEDRIGKGGMASVWRASRGIGAVAGREGAAPAAVKVLNREFVNHNPKAYEMFVSEATIASKVDSPHVVTVYDVGKDPGTGLVYIGMQLLNGVTLDKGPDPDDPKDASLGPLYEKKQWIRNGRLGTDPLPLSRVCHIIGQTLEAMAAVHNMQPGDPVIHRDLKPSNMILGKTPGGDDFVYVLDFGIARFREVGEVGAGRSYLATSEKTILGTYPYMSPEHWDKKFCQGSDIFQIGIILYEMLTGRKPFGGDEGEADVTILNNIINRPFPPPDERESGLPRSHTLRSVIDKALAKDSGERYRKCEDFLQDLRAACDGKGEAPSGSGPKPKWPLIFPFLIGAGLFGWLGYITMEWFLF